jgi:hypothetical protein
LRPGLTAPDEGASRLGLTLVALGVGDLWIFVQFFADFDFGHGVVRAALLALAALCCLALLIAGGREPLTKVLQAPRPEAAPIFMICVTLVLLGFLLELMLTLDLLLTALLGLGVSALGIMAALLIPARSLRLVRIYQAIGLALVILIVGRVAIFLFYLNKDGLLDIARTTIAAADALRHGVNPYGAALDVNPAYPDYAGYKYLPMMIFTYMPLASAFGSAGMRLTNLLLEAATVMILAVIAKREFGESHAAPAAALYLMLPLLPEMLYRGAVTDLAPALPLLAAMLFYRRRPGLAGLMVGLSISAKLFPGLLALPCWLPPMRRSRYAAGALCGLLPIIPFLLFAPSDLLRSVVGFIASRPPDSTSWLHDAPPFVVAAARCGFLGLLAAASIVVWFRRPEFLTRAVLYVLCIIGALLIGPSMHNNYLLWWMPAFCLLLSWALMRLLPLSPAGPVAAATV